MLIKIARPFAFVALVILYLMPLPFIMLRNGCHRVLRFLDDSFDYVAALVGWDPRYWPLPKAGEAPLPYSEDW